MCSNARRDPAKRGRARDATSTSAKDMTSNFGRGITSSSRSSATLSIGRGRGTGKGTTSSSVRGTTVSIRMGRGSSSRRGTTKTGRSSREIQTKTYILHLWVKAIDGTSSIDDFWSEMGNADCLEAMGNRRQTRDRRIGHYGSVNGRNRK